MSNWEDTVMTKDKEVKVGLEKVAELGLKDILELSNEQFRDAILQAQAEISFKVGEQIGIAKGVMLKTQDLALLNEKEIAELNAQAEDFYNKAKLVGIREVVERYKKDNPSSYKKYQVYWEGLGKEWRIK